MNKNTFFIAAFLGMLAPQVQAAPYVGVGTSYKLIDVDHVSGSNTRNTLTLDSSGSNIIEIDVKVPYTYADEYRGLSFLAGYRFKDSPWAVELSYFKSSVSDRKAIVSDEYADGLYTKTKTQVESFSIDVIGHYPLASLNKVSLLGAVGVLHQKMMVEKQYGVPLIPNGFAFTTKKQDVSDTRLQLGLGMQYDINDAISARAMLSAVPSGFSMTKGTPYSMNASVLYHF